MKSAAKLKVRVIPNAKKTEFTGFREDELVLRLSAPALEGKANKAATEYVARYFGVPRREIEALTAPVLQPPGGRHESARHGCSAPPRGGSAW